MTINEITGLRNIVRVGTVSSVDFDSRTARVIFADKSDPETGDMISGPLKVIQNQPQILFRKWIEDNSVIDGKDPQFVREIIITEGANPNYEHIFHSYHPKEGVGEKYAKGGLADVREYETYMTSDPTYKTKPDYIKESSGTLIKVYPWLPYIGQFVLCVYLPNGESDGFVLGGL
jgi:hypothetical protein